MQQHVHIPTALPACEPKHSLLSAFFSHGECESTLFATTFGVLSVCCAVLVGYAQCCRAAQVTNYQLQEEQKSFKWTYIVPFLLAMAGDWLQGPYVYALYQSYGYSQQQIAALFVVGFGSAMLSGTIVGSLADRYGRKRLALVFVAVYVCSCLTKHCKHLAALMLGRFLGGIATALLFSVFESWVVCENARRNFSAETLSAIFSVAHLSNAIVAILSGLLAQVVSGFAPLSGGPWLFFGGPVAPFDAAVVFLLLAGAVIGRCWSENFGDQPRQEPCRSSALKALTFMWRCKQVLALGLVQSLFEGSMYCFVFMWTPMIGRHFSRAPKGLVFSTFMVACMIGSQVFGLRTNRTSVLRPRVVLPVVFAASSISFACVAAGLGGVTGTYLSFMAFEVCVGVYFPAMAMLKSEIVPDSHRATIYNLYRVPLNIVVLVMLLTGLSPSDTFTGGAVLLALALMMQLFVNTSDAKKRREYDVLPGEKTSSHSGKEDDDFYHL